MYLLYQARRKVCALSACPSFIGAVLRVSAAQGLGPSAAAANLTPVPISGPSLPARLRLAALHAVETAAVVIGRARG